MAKTKGPKAPAYGTAEVDDIARVVHEAVRAWQITTGSSGLPRWEAAPQDMKDATKKAVKSVLDGGGDSIASGPIETQLTVTITRLLFGAWPKPTSK